jgi:hypothetical protein
MAIIRPDLPKALLKPPFPKGEFSGIIKRLSNPPCPPLTKGGKILPFIGAFFLRENFLIYEVM